MVILFTLNSFKIEKIIETGIIIDIILSNFPVGSSFFAC